MTATIGRRLRPILFSAPMVLAILDGRKTQTRRVVKPQPVGEVDVTMIANNVRPSDGAVAKYNAMSVGQAEDTQWFSSPYIEGDILWVREGLRLNPEGVLTYDADGTPVPMTDDLQRYLGNKKTINAYSPSMHMPRCACRLHLHVTSVDIQRVQDITGQDAVAEGLGPDPDYPDLAYGEFAELWNMLNDARGYGWFNNPWVWVYQFGVCRVTKP